MSDIFISYSSTDRNRVLPLVNGLEKTGWSVFWDITVPAGKTWRQVIHSEIEGCRAVVVVWTAQSITSEWVLEEAEIGKSRRILIPVLLDNVRPPFGFGNIQSANLVAWNGDSSSPNFTRLIADIAAILGSSPVAVQDNEERRRLEARARRFVDAVLLQEVVKQPGAVFRDTFTDGSQGPEMVVIPTGTFKMGDIQGTGSNSEKPVHIVGIGKPFAMGRYPITFEDYDRFASATGHPLPNDQGWGRERRPAINVSWHDAVEYTKWLSGQTGKQYRLPTEAEWEYAARAGTETDYWWGNQIGTKMANWGSGDPRWTKLRPSPVGNFKPNLFGLYDTAGNVWEWVQDCWHPNYQSAPNDGSAWEIPDAGNQRVLRGGSWNVGPEAVRSSTRLEFASVDRKFSIGFRLARDLD